eukprot:6181388-Pleurochrysis_carterae.AAC.4
MPYEQSVRCNEHPTGEHPTPFGSQMNIAVRALASSLKPCVAHDYMCARARERGRGSSVSSLYILLKCGCTRNLMSTHVRAFIMLLCAMSCGQCNMRQHEHVKAEKQFIGKLSEMAMHSYAGTMLGRFA